MPKEWVAFQKYLAWEQWYFNQRVRKVWNSYVRSHANKSIYSLASKAQVCRPVQRPISLLLDLPLHIHMQHTTTIWLQWRRLRIWPSPSWSQDGYHTTALATSRVEERREIIGKTRWILYSQRSIWWLALHPHNEFVDIPAGWSSWTLNMIDYALDISVHQHQVIKTCQN